MAPHRRHTKQPDWRTGQTNPLSFPLVPVLFHFAPSYDSRLSSLVYSSVSFFFSFFLAFFLSLCLSLFQWIFVNSSSLPPLSRLLSALPSASCGRFLHLLPVFPLFVLLFLLSSVRLPVSFSVGFCQFFFASSSFSRYRWRFLRNCVGHLFTLSLRPLCLVRSPPCHSHSTRRHSMVEGG